MASIIITKDGYDLKITGHLFIKYLVGFIKMNNYFSASVIIAFYNNTIALNTIFKALEGQSKYRIEIIVADDGSNEGSVKELNKIIANSHLAVQHIHQLNKGFRKNRILNKAISISKSDYLILIDGDCIPQEYFVEDHIENKQKQHILNGRRVDLPASFAKQLLASKAPQYFFKDNVIKIFAGYLFFKQGKNIEKGLRIKNSLLSRYLNKGNKGIVGCNFSIHKSDIESVNGFDNQYEVAGFGEDSDIEYRLRLNNIHITNIFYQANMLHLIHEELPRLKEAGDLYEKLMITKKAIAENGLEQAFNEN